MCLLKTVASCVQLLPACAKRAIVLWVRLLGGAFVLEGLRWKSHSTWVPVCLSSHQLATPRETGRLCQCSRAHRTSCGNGWHPPPCRHTAVQEHATACSTMQHCAAARSHMQQHAAPRSSMHHYAAVQYVAPRNNASRNSATRSNHASAPNTP